MKSNESVATYLIDIIVFLFGFIFLLLMGYFSNTTIKELFEALGTSLIAASIVSLLIRRIYFNHPKKEIEYITSNRKSIEQRYIKLKYNAHELDVVSIALVNLLIEFSSESDTRLINRILFGKANVRLMFLSPTSSFIQQRAIEDGLSESELKEIIKNSIINCIKIFAQLKKFHGIASSKGTLRPENSGNFEIKLIDMCPYFTIFRADDEIYVGIYTSALKGPDSSVLRVGKKQYSLYDQFRKHFDKLWDTTITNFETGNFIIRYHGPHSPILNIELVNDILGEPWENYLQDDFR